MLKSNFPLAALGRSDVIPGDVDFMLSRGWIEDFHALAYAMHVPRKLRIP
jgi:hypothetical protein